MIHKEIFILRAFISSAPFSLLIMLMIALVPLPQGIWNMDYFLFGVIASRLFYFNVLKG